MRGGSKKGLSTIVSTLLILLLVFVAVSILWVVVRNIIQTGTEQVSLGDYTLNLKIESVEISGNSFDVRVKRESGAGTFTGLNFIMSTGDAAEVIEVNNVTMNEYVSRTYTLTPQQVSVSEVNKIEIAPIFTLDSGKTSVGDIKDSYALTPAVSTIVCGNGIIESGETCDDNNVVAGDGCSATCTIETNYTCSGQPSNCTLA